ncbi:hypothetical protein [Agriterribacter sp.]|uniref:hypothetical protein n=1 Tax=Agriterribacter sp. TaxID=2821509 RepID=UPI002BE58243|nr:hypothetical protein [Agriterribacter sp.]HRO46371.1 hypothetical protein [Agriterribacter sp.]HRQ18558.1 hypothetical protein [Agriterribacter sp.]
MNTRILPGCFSNPPLQRLSPALQVIELHALIAAVTLQLSAADSSVLNKAGAW